MEPMTDVLSPRRTATRERLIDAALQVFAEQGVGGASLERVCDVAGFTRGAFYSNFESRNALCLAVLEYQAQENLSAARQVVEDLRARSSDSAEDVIRQAVGAFLAAQRSDRTWVLASSEMRLFAVREASLRQAYLDQVRHLSGTFTQLLQDAAASLGYEFTVPVDEVIPVLQAVFEHGQINTMIAGEDGPSQAIRVAQFVAVLQAMLRPSGSPGETVDAADP